ncbi:MAG: LssY C-terminal domain-containing protein, partial [Gemmataceae bacterium]
MASWLPRWLGVPFRPLPEERPFLERLALQEDDQLAVRVAVLSDREAERFFGVPLARRGMQPVWLQIINKSDSAYRLRLASLDPSYYPPLEAAYLNHFAIGKRLVGFGLLAWLFFLPLLLLLPFRLMAALIANRQLDAHFQQHALGWGLIRPGQVLSGFVFTAHDEGTKQVPVRLLGTSGVKEFDFSIPVAGRKLDHSNKQLEEMLRAEDVQECDEAALRDRLMRLPRCTGNRHGTKEGDPLNLVVVGDFDTILRGFGARWDETEIISVSSCWRMVKSFVFGSTYRYSPVSSLFVDGRCQDFALQRARQTINQRLHLRLWVTSLRFQGKPVWIGQISRDIGVRFTLKTWNLTTHKIDPDVDDARDYLLDDLLEAGRVLQVGYVGGVEAAPTSAPRRNL